MSVISNPVQITPDDLQSRLAKIRGQVDAISQIVTTSNSARSNSDDAQRQLELADACLAKAHAALAQTSRRSMATPDDHDVDALDWEFHVAEPPARQQGTVCVTISPDRLQIAPPLLDAPTE